MEALRRAGRKGEGVFHRKQEGASALEFALVLPILVVLIFGAFSVGLGYERKLAMAHAARDSVRVGATLPFEPTGTDGEPDLGWFEKIRDRAVAASTSQLDPASGDGIVVCIAYVSGNPGSTREPSSKAIQYTSNGGTWSQTAPPTGDYCFDDKLGDRYCTYAEDGTPSSAECPSKANYDPDLEGRVQVEVRRGFDFNLVLVPARVLTLTSRSVAQYEENGTVDS